MKIKIIALGKIKEKFLKDGIDEFLKRLTPYASVSILELNPIEIKDENLIDKILLEEGEKILSAVKSANKEFITKATIFDIYKGENVPSGKKSIAIHITITQKDKTLTDEEINSIFKSAIDKVIALGGILRDK